MLLSRKPKPPPSRLMQLHEYIDLLHGGTEDHAASDAIKRSAVELAGSLCEPLRLNAWTAPGLAQVFARQQPMLDCPDFGVAEAANEANIRRWIPLLKDKTTAFAVIERRGGTYMQVFADAKGFQALGVVRAVGGLGARPTQSRPFRARNPDIRSATCTLLRSENGKCVLPRMPSSGRCTSVASPPWR